MKRFYLFNIDQECPGGGMSDFIRDFDTIEEAFAFGETFSSFDFHEVFDSQTGKIHWKGDKGVVQEQDIEREDLPTK